MLDLKDLYLTPHGRLGRQTYWLALAGLVVANLVAGLIPVIGSLVALALLWPCACVIAKRLHDMGRSGWPAFALTFPCAILGLFAALVALMTADLTTAGLALAAAGVVAVVGSLVGLAGLVLIVWAGVAPSQRGVNAYGQQALRPFPLS